MMALLLPAIQAARETTKKTDDDPLVDYGLGSNPNEILDVDNGPLVDGFMRYDSDFGLL